jgi:hypothetical protein
MLNRSTRKRVRSRWRIPPVLLLAIAIALYTAVLYPWFLHWGSTPLEQQMPLPVDSLLHNPAHRFTRAITIQAPPSAVWNWIVQMGQDRAGFYSNTWLENLACADIHNAGSLHPEWQHRALGDRVPLARPDLLGGYFGETAQTRIVALEPERMIANIPGPIVLLPLDGGGTRVLLREALPASPLARFAGALVWDPMHFVMQQRMLRGIRERAEGRPLVPPWLRAAARAGWALAGAGLVWILWPRRRLWLAAPLLAAVPVLWTTGDVDAALAGLLAIGIPIALAPRWGLILVLAIAVAFVLLVAPDPHTAFGALFLLAAPPLVKKSTPWE